MSIPTEEQQFFIKVTTHQGVGGGFTLARAAEDT
jgi:hypothetical protein